MEPGSRAARRSGVLGPDELSRRRSPRQSARMLRPAAVPPSAPRSDAGSQPRSEPLLERPSVGQSVPPSERWWAAPSERQSVATLAPPSEPWSAATSGLRLPEASEPRSAAALGRRSADASAPASARMSAAASESRSAHGSESPSRVRPRRRRRAYALWVRATASVCGSRSSRVPEIPWARSSRAQAYAVRRENGARPGARPRPWRRRRRAQRPERRATAAVPPSARHGERSSSARPKARRGRA